MNGLQELLFREREADWQRRAARYRRSGQVAASRRWRRRAEQAGRRAERLEASIAGSARADYELAGR